MVAPRNIDLNQILAGVESLLKRLIGEDIELTIDYAPDAGVIHADPGQLEHLLVNLAANARDAMPGAGKLHLETRRVWLDASTSTAKGLRGPGDHILLSVTDTGEGMPEDVQAHIFEPFFTTKPKSKGTGLGLATVFGIVESFHGVIEVSSVLGEGTRFSIYVPIVDHASEALVSAMGSEQQIDALPHGSETLLCVEDDPQVRQVVHLVATRLGYQVLVASDGVEALRVSSAHRGTIQLLLTDVIMPEMNGLQVAEQLQAERPGIKVIYMSGYSDEVLSEHGVLKSGYTLINKPFTVDQLAHAFRAVLD